jgi:hypothetical protein
LRCDETRNPCLIERNRRCEIVPQVQRPRLTTSAA